MRFALLRTLLAVIALAVPATHAQVQPDSPGAMPLADYLGLLEQIAPAARRGAEAYLGAYRQRCGRSLTTDDLRTAMSRDGGEPTLMAMIRASQLQDAKAIAVLSRRVTRRSGT